MSGNCCDNNNKHYLSHVIYDCDPFVCPGFPELSLEPCDNMCNVIKVIMDALCELKSAVGFTNVNVGGGEEVFRDSIGTNENFRTLVAGGSGNVTVATVGDTIEIDATGLSETLAQTLVLGNNTGGTNIVLEDDIIEDSGNGGMLRIGQDSTDYVALLTDSGSYLTTYLWIDAVSGMEAYGPAGIPLNLNFGGNVIIRGSTIKFGSTGNTGHLGELDFDVLTAQRKFDFQDEDGVIPVGPAWDTLIANPTAVEDDYVITWRWNGGAGAEQYELRPSGGGEANTASNVGGGIGIFYQKTGVDLEFKSLIAGLGVTLDNVTDPEEIIISATAGLQEACIGVSNDYDTVPGPYTAANNVPSLQHTITVDGTYHIAVSLNTITQPNDSTEFRLFKNGLALSGLGWFQSKTVAAAGEDQDICHWEECAALVVGDVINVVAFAIAAGRGVGVGSSALFIQRID